MDSNGDNPDARMRIQATTFTKTPWCTRYGASDAYNMHEDRTPFAQAYCEEFELRFNRRNSVKRPTLFARIIEGGLLGAASTFRESRAGGHIAAAS